MGIKIITDGGVDLPTDIIQSYGLDIVPLTVTFQEVPFQVELGADAFYAAMRSNSDLPKTASPSPYDFLHAFQLHQEHDIIVITVSSALSGTYNSALIAKDTFIEEGYQGRIEVLDSRTASLGQGMIVIQALEAATNQLSFDQLVQSAKQWIQKTRTYFTLDTLENVIRGGRLDRLRGTVASMLNIKLVLRASEEGTVDVVEKARGTRNAVNKLLDKLSHLPEHVKHRIGVAHSNCEVRAKELIEQIRSRGFQDILLSNMGPVIGTYAGEGALLVTFTEA